MKFGYSPFGRFPEGADKGGVGSISSGDG